METDREITLSELPQEIKDQIPFSLKTYKDTYKISELPYELQNVIEHYLKRDINVVYDILYDAKPYISEYGDLKGINNIYDLVVEYIKTYLLVQPNNYPFDPSFGCRLKQYVQKLDTSTQYLLVSNEVDQIAKVVASDLNISVQVISVNIERASSTGIDTEYNVRIQLKINNLDKSLTVSVT